MRKILFILPILLCFISCKEGGETPNTEPEIKTPPVIEQKVSGPTPGNFTSDRQYNLNLVYFVPNDAPAIANYQKRLSELMLWGQNWFKTQMGLNGYGNQTFGLFTDATKTAIKIITIYGTKGKADYPYSGGAAAVQAEINAYFNANPSQKTSDHTLVIMPRYSLGADGNPSGGPFYGLGKWCFALDYEGLNIANLGKTDAEGKRFSVWYGGLIHELGHGLNLPHNRHKVSEASDPNKGMALMWAGNGTLGISPTFLTAADAAILNVNQIFNNNTNSYYGSVTAGISNIKAEYSAAKNAIILSGKFTSSNKVKSIIYYNDPNYNGEGPGVNHDYNAITWESKPVGTDGFYIEMPINELVYTDNNTPYELKVKLVHENGNVTETIYSYNFVNNIPILNFSSRDELSKIGWKVSSFSSEETSGEGTTNGRINTIIDGTSSTYWHSQWTGSSASYPHQFVIDIATNTTAKGVSFTHRSGLQRAVKTFDVLVSSDGINFTTAGSYVTGNVNGPQYFDFNTSRTFRYFKVIANSSWDGEKFAAIAEVGLY
ncbi:MAG TPA: discoidin domain-containing protein [Pedobacter sp.]|nr:discoidin domain-containing protein [Pedobacter sp.]